MSQLYHKGGPIPANVQQKRAVSSAVRPVSAVNRFIPSAAAVKQPVSVKSAMVARPVSAVARPVSAVTKSVPVLARRDAVDAVDDAVDAQAPSVELDSSFSMSSIVKDCGNCDAKKYQASLAPLQLVYTEQTASLEFDEQAFAAYAAQFGNGCAFRRLLSFYYLKGVDLVPVL